MAVDLRRSAWFAAALALERLVQRIGRGLVADEGELLVERRIFGHELEALLEADQPSQILGAGAEDLETGAGLRQNGAGIVRQIDDDGVILLGRCRLQCGSSAVACRRVR
jgi:hypothetical protein